MTELSFKKDLKLQNILLDEFVSSACQIKVICLNFDGQGNALCRCDGQVREISLRTMRKVIFGISKEALKNYLHAIFDPDYYSEDIRRDGDGKIIFNLPELQKLKKYDITNLAKSSLKDLHDLKLETIYYFREQEAAAENQGGCTFSALYGNTKSRVFHKPDCPSFNAINCTSLFNSHAEAVAANFKPCRICKP